MKHHYMFLFSLMLITFVPLVFSTPGQDEELNKLPTSAPISPTKPRDGNESLTVVGPLSNEQILKSLQLLNKFYIETGANKNPKVAATITALQAKKQ